MCMYIHAQLHTMGPLLPTNFSGYRLDYKGGTLLYPDSLHGIGVKQKENFATKRKEGVLAVEAVRKFREVLMTFVC